MAGSTLTTAASALKDFYLPAVREQLNNAHMIVQQIEKNKEDVEGLNAVISLHVSRNSGVGARAELGTLPTAGAQGYRQERIPTHYNYGRIQVSGPQIKAMKSDKGSFVRAVDSEMSGLESDLKREVARQYYGTSDGVIATAGTTTASNTVVLASSTSLTKLRQFAAGDHVDIGTVSTPTTIASDRTITAVDRTAKTITISGATVSTTSGTHFIFRAGNGGSGASQKEITGLQTIVNDSGTLHNVDPTDVALWASYVGGNAGTNRTPTDSVFEVAVDEVFTESGEDTNLIVTSLGVSRAYADTLKSQKRFNDTVNLKGGFKALTVTTGRGDQALTADKDAPANKAFLLNTKHLKLYEVADWDWADEDGAVLSRVSGVDAYEAYMYQYAELATDQRNTHGRVDDLTEA